MRTRLACSLFIVLIAAAPVLRAMCDLDCVTPTPVAASSVEGHCASRDDAPATPAPPDRCSHDHSGTLATQAADKTKPDVPAQADFAYERALSTMATVPATAGTVGTAAESPPLSHQTPLRI